MKQVTAALLGAGQRGALAYASYALEHPDELKIVAVAEPITERRDAFCAAHRISCERAFVSWEDLLSYPRMADCIMVCTQDDMHYQPVMRALDKGYHVLCEKPMAIRREEILQMGQKAEESGLIFSVCYVLRYSPFFRSVKRMLDDGLIGRLVSIQHLEGVGYWHAAHSFVRGNWRRADQGSPMILQKCSHDIDILLWLAGADCASVSSYGSLLYFKPENAPEGAPTRCTDGCLHREGCPYYAPRFYLSHPKAVSDNFVSVLTMDDSPEGILRALREGPYGRCVFHCDNDVVDHQVVNLSFQNGMTATLTMCDFTQKCERVVNLMGTHGQIQGNMEDNRIEHLDFATGNRTITTLSTSSYGHSGSDEAMMRDFVSQVASGCVTNNCSGGLASVQSHLIALAAEESRIDGGKSLKIRKS